MPIKAETKVDLNHTAVGNITSPVAAEATCGDVNIVG